MEKKQQYNQHTDSMISQKGKILWEGSPKPEFSITVLEGNGYYDVMSGATSILGFALAGIVIAAFAAYQTGHPLLMVLVILFGIFLLILPDILKGERKRKTRYYITEQGVIFQLWQRRKRKMKFIPFEDINKLSLEVFDNGRGNISLFTNKEVDFKTYDFEKSKALLYPTIVMVDKAREVVALLKEKMRK